MFCSECGVEASGKFCWKCGAPLHSAEGAAVAAPSPRDWVDEIQYDSLIQHPEVKRILSGTQPAAGTKRLSGEDFLAAFDRLSALPMTTVGKIGQEIGSRLGIGTGKSQTRTFAAGPGKVIVGVLSSLLRRGRTLRSATQYEDGCLLEASLPSDMWSLEGDLAIMVRRQGGGAAVEAVTKIAGQLMDWGKSKKALQELFDDVEQFAGSGGPLGDGAAGRG
jgi:hypothetical protein